MPQISLAPSGEMALQLKSHVRVRASRRDAQYSTCVRIVYRDKDWEQSAASTNLAVV